jgi:hypothetical protein
MRALALIVILNMTLVVVSLGQGTLEFQNINAAAGVNAPVYQADEVTKLSGSQFMAELLVGMDSASLGSIATTGFLTDNGAGYFIAPVQTVPNISPGVSVFAQVDVWNTALGATFSQAKSSGLPNSWWASSIFSVTLGGGNINPMEPAALTGLGNSPVYLNGVPEPSTFALAGLGAAIVLSRLRRRRYAE